MCVTRKNDSGQSGRERGSMLGVIGRNGSGKTTLMRIIAGILQPDEGKIDVVGTVAPLFALGTGFHPDLTGRENVFFNGTLLGLDRLVAGDKRSQQLYLNMEREESSRCVEISPELCLSRASVMC